MERAYVGESFVLSFDIHDARDASRTVDAADWTVRMGDYEETGTCDVDGNTATFRFFADRAGIHDIIISYRMGQDAWKARFKISVEEP